MGSPWVAGVGNAQAHKLRDRNRVSCRTSVGDSRPGDPRSDDKKCTLGAGEHASPGECRKHATATQLFCTLHAPAEAPSPASRHAGT